MKDNSNNKNNTNPNKYYSKYNDNIKSYKGFGSVRDRQPPDEKSTTSTIKPIFQKDIQIIPPLFQRTIDVNPQYSNGNLNVDNYVNYEPEINKYYYVSQQMDKPKILKDAPMKYKKKLNLENPIQMPPPLVTTPPHQYLLKNLIKSESKNNINFEKSENSDNSQTNTVLSNQLINKARYGDRYLYTFEPRYNSVIKPQRAYTWMYPFSPNTDNYFRDDINTSYKSPILFNNLPDYSPLPDYNSSSSNIDSIDYFNTDNGSVLDDFNKNKDLVIIIIILLIIIIIKK